MTSRSDLSTALKSLRKTVVNAQRNAGASSILHVSAACRLSVDEMQALSNFLMVSASQCVQQPPQALYELVQSAVSPAIVDALPAPNATVFTKTGRADQHLAPAVFQQLRQSAFGYIYQFFCSDNRQLAQKRAETGNKSSSLQELISFTQLYTPDWVVEHLVQQCLLPQWQGSTAVVNAALFHHDPAKWLKTNQWTAHDLTVIDPSCGSGHFLLGAYDLLMQMYLAEGFSRSVAAQDILKHNLYGCDIDAIALWISALSLIVKALPDLNKNNNLNLPPLNLALVADAVKDANGMGSLRRDWDDVHILSKKYAAVLGNPPYIGRKLQDRQLKQQLKQSYPNSHQDLATAFLERGLELLRPAGRLGYIAQASMLYLPTYADLRHSLIEKHTIVSMVEAGTKVFPLLTGEKVNSMLLVVQAGKNDSYSSLFIDLKAEADKSLSLANILQKQSSDNDSDYGPTKDSPQLAFRRQQKDFQLQRKTAFNYRCSPGFLNIQSQCKNLAELAQIKQGLATTDNARFLRWWWQVPPAEIGTKWIPYVKGGGSERWYHPVESVVLWENDGQEIKETVAANYPYLKGKTEWVVKNQSYYRREGLTFSFVNANQLAVRHLPASCIFDVAGSSLFPNQQENQYFLLAYLNSSFVACAASMINPTINFQVGDLKLIPIIDLAQQTIDELSHLGERCVQLKRGLWRFSANAFGLPEAAEIQECLQGDPGKIWNRVHQSLAADVQEIIAAETRIDELVLDALAKAMRNEDHRAIKSSCATATKKRKHLQLPITGQQQFAAMLISTLLYKCVGQTLDFHEDQAVRATLNLSSQASTWLKTILGMTIPQFIENDFLPHQMHTLHDTVRLTPRWLDNSKVLFLPAETGAAKSSKKSAN